MPVDAALARRQSFYLKTDIAVDDGELQGLPVSNRAEAERRSDELAALLARYLALSHVIVSPAQQQGTFHLVHECRLPDGQTLIIRSSLDTLFSADTSFYADQDIQQRLSVVGLPAVAVHAVNCQASVAPYAWMLMNKAPGQSMAALSDATLDAPFAMQRLGQIMKLLHGRITALGCGPVDCMALAAGDGLRGVHAEWRDFAFCRWDDHCRRAVTGGLLHAHEAAEIQSWARTAEADIAAPGQSLLHGDPGNPNFFMHDDQICALLDWEDAVIGDPLYDVAFWATFHPRRRWHAFFAGYGGAPVAATAAGLRFAFYFLRITLAKVLHRQRFGYYDQPGRPSGRQRVEDAIGILREAVNPAQADWLRLA